MRTIGIDLDLTLIKSFLVSNVSKMIGYSGLTQEDVIDFQFSNFPENFQKKAREYVLDPLYMCTLAKPIDGAQEWVNMVSREHDRICIITARGSSIQEETIRMCRGLFPEITAVFFVEPHENKLQLFKDHRIDVWIDDAAHGVIDAVELGIETYMVSNKYTKYNHHIRNNPKIKVVDSIKEICLKG